MAVTASSSEKHSGRLTIDRLLEVLDYFSASAAGTKFDTLSEYATARAAIIAIKTKFDV